MISAVEKWDGLSGKGVCFRALVVVEQRLEYYRRESCVGCEVGEASKFFFTYKILFLEK